MASRVACWIRKAICTYSHTHVYAPVYPHAVYIIAVKILVHAQFHPVKNILSLAFTRRIKCNNYRDAIQMTCGGDSKKSDRLTSTYVQ
jgi:hypothetical protein